MTHSPLPVDAWFPSYVTICGRVALATTDNSSTPAGSPPSLGTANSVSREDAGDTTGGVTHENGGGDDDGASFPWIAVAVGVLGIGVIAGLLWHHARTRAAASTTPDQDDAPE